MALKRTTREPSAFDEFMEIFSSPTTEQKEKDSKVLHPFANVDKTVVIQESRIFHDSKLVKEQPHTCCRILAQLIRIKDLNKQPFTEVEATEMFFSSTKLFVSDDASLRRMLYLFIKEFYVLCDFNNVIIVTSSLTKDMTCDIDLYRANALRVLSRIIDSAMLGAIERYVKQAIVDRSHAVASGALVSAIHLYERCPENAVIVRRWISETQEAVKSPNPMVQFHGIQLLYQIKSHDRLGVSKLVSQYTKQRGVKSPMAIVLLIRYTAKLMRDEITSGRSSGVSINDSGSNTCQEGYQFLEKCLRHPSEMVMYEAARDICSLPAMEAEDLNPAVNVLQGFLGSGKPTIRYVSMKTLSKVAEKHPRIVSKCNQEFEQLIYDKNHLVSTIAVTTLLKTGSEETIGSLLEPISKFMDSMDDDNRVSVVRSLYRLCIKYPAKHVLLIGFMSRFLRDRGGFEFKRAIVQSIVSLIRAMPEIAESALLQLCEYIEDCEYLQLATEIIHTLGEMGPSLPAKAEFIPYIYNRMILEQHEIRSAGVLSLFKFAAQCPSLRSSILPLIKQSLNDEDDETRDRAVLAVNLIERAMEAHPYSPPLMDAKMDDIPPDTPSADDPAAIMILPLPMSFDRLERSLRAYKATPIDMESSDPVTFSSLPIIEETAEETEVAARAMDISGLEDEEETEPHAEILQTDPAAAVYAVPELASLGHVFRSCPSTQLTESESEYIVHCVKHIFVDHVVLQFVVENTIEDQRLDNVTVAIEGAEDEHLYEVIGEVAADPIAYGQSQNCFTVLKQDMNMSLSPCSYHCELHFTVVTLDDGEEVGESIEEEYALDSLEILPSDYMAKVSVPDFRKAWEDSNSDAELLQKFELPFKTREAAVASLLRLLGMKPCDGTGTVSKKDKAHMLHLSGVFVGGHPVLVRAQIASVPAKDDVPSKRVILKIAVRSDDKVVSQKVLEFIS